MEQREIESLVVKLGMFAAGLKDLGDHLARQSHQATQDIVRSAHSLATTAEQTASSISTQLETVAAKAISDGARSATQRFEGELHKTSSRLAITTSNLEQQMRSAGRLHTTSAWKGFFTAGAAALIALAAACTLTWQMIAHVQDGAWWAEVQRARAMGTLQPCPEGGVCVYVKKRWHRISQ